MHAIKIPATKEIVTTCREGLELTKLHMIFPTVPLFPAEIRYIRNILAPIAEELEDGVAKDVINSEVFNDLRHNELCYLESYMGINDDSIRLCQIEIHLMVNQHDECYCALIREIEQLMKKYENEEM